MPPAGRWRSAGLRRAATIAAAVLVPLLYAAPGVAGTASFDGTTFRYVAAPGEANRVTVRMGDTCRPYDEPQCGFAMLLEERGAPLVAGPACRKLSAYQVTCVIGAAWQYAANDEQLAHLALGDADDWAETAGACPPHDGLALCDTLVEGGDGDDTLRGALPGSMPGARDQLRGGPGRDDVRGGYELDGGPGADTLRGYAGLDPKDVSRAVYRDRDRPVFVTLDRRRDDGERGENDLVFRVSGVEGGAGNDVLVGNVRTNIFYGGHGRDLIVARGGSDRAYGDDFRTLVDPFCHPYLGGADRIYGGRGRDRLRGCGGADFVSGGPGPDYIDGQRGRDRIGGGSGRDRLAGAAGNDTFLARDRYPDAVFGGRGRDRARVDARLDTRRSIERLLR